MLVVTRFKLQLAIGRYPRGSECGVNKSNTPSLFSSSAVSGPITGNADVNKEIACETDKKKYELWTTLLQQSTRFTFTKK